MTWTKTWINPRRTGVAAVALPLRLAALVTVLLAASGCGLVDVNDPTAVEDEQLNNAAGAALLRGNALGQFYSRFGFDALAAGMLTDEFTMYLAVTSNQSVSGVDRRDLTSSGYPGWSEVRRAITVAAAKLQAYGPRAHAGEMLALRGYATLQLAANYCPGFPIHEMNGFAVTVGTPVTTSQAYERALADFDSALTAAADSARVLHFARVGRAAALLGLGRFAEAAEAASDVPTAYAWYARYVSGESPNRVALTGQGNGYDTVADQEGGNGLDFLSAGDPRVQVRQYATAEPPAGAGEPVYTPAKYADDGAPIVVASGIEARLIEAEAALATDGPWLTILNDLRATQVSPALPALTDPGTPEARLDLLFRERAFWLFATGHRLADLVRLVRLYDRDPESVFPVGSYHQHGHVYGTGTSFPIFASQEPSNPAVTGCTGI